jgi:cell division protein FtsB
MRIAWWQHKSTGWVQCRAADVEALRQRVNRLAAEVERLKAREARLIEGLLPVYVAHQPLASAIEDLARVQLDKPEREPEPVASDDGA